MSPTLLRRHASWIIALAAGCAFAGFLSFGGVPLLRHDWSWDPGPSFFSNAWSSFGGWQTAGIGQPRPYPTDYLLVALDAIFVRVAGNWSGYFLHVWLTGIACAGGGIALARRFDKHWTTSLAAAVFATFNPWVYNEVVAGHLSLVLAYAATMLVAAEMSSENPSLYRLTAFVLLTMEQLQFFLPAGAALVVWTAMRRKSAIPLLVVAMCSLPIWIGVAFERGYLLETPYTTTWQNGASLDPVRALVLSGYFTHYAGALPWISGAAVWCVFALALGGAGVAIARSRRAAIAVVIAVVVWALATGTKGPLAAAYLWLVERVPESAVYRELYDVIAFLAVAYVCAAAALSSRAVATRWLWLACGAALFAGWIVAPPARFWVWSRDVPVATIDAARNTRFALMPPLQPLLFDGRGPGLDPDAVVNGGNVVPINTPQFGFPESTALVHYALTGDTRWLAALSVSQIVARPRFETSRDSLRMQLAVQPARAPARVAKNETLVAQPELSLRDLPGLAALPGAPWEDAVFFGDASTVAGPDVPPEWRAAVPVRAIAPPSRALSARDGWVDVRSAFVALPDLAQGLGGTITTDPRAALAVRPGEFTLAHVRGRIVDGGGRRLADSTGSGYRWLPPFGVSTIYCRGLCALVAQTVRPVATRNPSASGGCHRDVTFRLPASWLAVADLAASPRCLLHYNVRFDPHWTAVLGGARLAHVAIDSTTNGWVVPAHQSAQRLVLIESVAALQFFFQACSIAVLAAIGLRCGVVGLRRIRRAA
jgi:hypothetical protein